MSGEGGSLRSLRSLRLDLFVSPLRPRKLLQCAMYDDDDRGSGTRNQAFYFTRMLTVPLFIFSSRLKVWTCVLCCLAATI